MVSKIGIGLMLCLASSGLARAEESMMGESSMMADTPLAKPDAAPEKEKKQLNNPALLQPFEAASVKELQKELAHLQEKLTEAQKSELDIRIQELRQELQDDPFVLPARVEAVLVSRLNGISPAELLTQEQTPREDSEVYWKLRESAYAERLKGLMDRQKAATTTRKLLETVYLYNTSVELSGPLTVEKATLRFQLRNGSEQPVQSLRFRLLLMLPEGSDKDVVKVTRYQSIRGNIQPWETKTIEHSIRDLLPENVILGPLSQRSQVFAEVRLENYKEPNQDWAVVDFRENEMLEMERSQSGINEARVAQGAVPIASNFEGMMME